MNLRVASGRPSMIRGARTYGELDVDGRRGAVEVATLEDQRVLSWSDQN
jgi:hypothetical protein